MTENRICFLPGVITFNLIDYISICTDAELVIYNIFF